MFLSGYTIGHVHGVPIRLHSSLLLLAVIFALRAGSVLLGLAAVVAIMASVALHELGHTYVALSFGCRVRDITLLILGGRATLLDMPREPWKEFVLAAGGPLVSAVLWLGALQALKFTLLVPALWGFVSYFAAINKMLLLFNLIPAFPMDGGRMLRSLLAQRLGRVRATFVASRIGRAAAVLMAVWGIFGGFNLILILIAWYIFQAAEAEYRMVVAEVGGGGYFGGGGPPDSHVVISPPPYKRGAVVAEIFRDN